MHHPGRLLTALLPGLFFGCTSAAPPPRKRPPPLVKAARPEVRDVEVTLAYTVEVKPIEQAELQSKVTGYVQTITVDKGDRVRRGQVLATIRPSELPEQVNQAREQVGQAEAQFKLESENTRRSRELYQRGLISKAELDNSEARLAVARATRGASQAGLGAVGARLRETTLVAPFDGWVTRRYADPGALVSPGPTSQSILQLMRIDTVRVFVSVLERDVPFVRRGLPVQVTVDAMPGRSFAGVVTRFAPALDPATRTLEAEIVIPNAEEKAPSGAIDRPLKPGMYGHAALHVATHKNAVVLPIEAVVAEDNARSVFVVDDLRPAPPPPASPGGADGKGEVRAAQATQATAAGERAPKGAPAAAPPREVGKARRLPVTVGFDGGSWLEIASGLHGDESVIVQGIDLVADGAPITVMRVQPAAGTGDGGARAAGEPGAAAPAEAGPAQSSTATGKL